MQPFDRVQTQDGTLNRIQDRIKIVLRAIISKPILDGQIIDSITLPAGVATNVAHKLGRKPKGWIPVQGVSTTITENSKDDKFLNLTAGATVTNTSIWVF